MKLDTLRGDNFLQTSGEPQVSGWLFSLETGKPSPPIVGSRGVIFIQPITDITQPQMPADLTMFRRQMSSQVSGELVANLMKSLEHKYKVEDNRSRFW